MKAIKMLAFGVALAASGAVIAQQCAQVQSHRGVTVISVNFSPGGNTTVRHQQYYLLDGEDGDDDAVLTIETELTDAQVAGRAIDLMSANSTFALAFRAAMNDDNLFLVNGAIREQVFPDEEPDDSVFPSGDGLCINVSGSTGSWPYPGNEVFPLSFLNCQSAIDALVAGSIAPGDPSVTFPYQGADGWYVINTSQGCGYQKDLDDGTLSAGVRFFYLPPPCETADLPSADRINEELDYVEVDRELSNLEVVERLQSMGPAASQQFFSTPYGRPLDNLFSVDAQEGADSFDDCTPGQGVGTGELSAGGGAPFYEINPPGGEPAPLAGAWSERPGSGPSASAAAEDSVENRNRSGIDIFDGGGSGGPGGPGDPGTGGDLTVDAFCANASQDYLMCSVDGTEGQTIEEFCDVEDNYSMCAQIDSEAIGELDGAYDTVLSGIDSGLIGPLGALGDNPVIDGQGYSDPSGSGCPAPIQINTSNTGIFSSANLEVDTELACNVARNFVKPFLILFATLAAFSIIVGASRGPTMPNASVH